MATNQEKFDGLAQTFQPGIEGKQNAGELYGRIVNAEASAAAAAASAASANQKLDALAGAPVVGGTPSAPVALTDADLQRLAAYIAAEIALGTFKFTKEG